jgi:hypothetical protein
VQHHLLEGVAPEELAHPGVSPDLDAWRLFDAIGQVAGHVPP